MAQQKWINSYKTQRDKDLDTRLHFFFNSANIPLYFKQLIIN